MSNGENTGTSRGEFLKRTAGVTGLVVGAGVWTRGARAASQADPAPAPDAITAAIGTRSFGSGNFALELDGASIGYLKSVGGGNAVAEVITEQTQGLFYNRKHIGTPKYEDITVQVGLSMGKSFYDWIANFWEGIPQRKTGAIIAADFDYNVRSRREFVDALISEVMIPALDGSSKDAAYMTVKIAPESALTKQGSGKLTVPVAKQKLWLTSNFKLEIDGLDATRVNKIESFTVKQGFVTDQIGGEREPTKEPGKVEFPNLKITLAQAGSQSWYDWFDDFVIQGNNGQEDERDGTLTFLAPDLKDELGRVRFFNLGIFKLSTETMEAGAVTRVVAELYCERMELGVGPPALPDG